MISSASVFRRIFINATVATAFGSGLTIGGASFGNADDAIMMCASVDTSGDEDADGDADEPGDAPASGGIIWPRPGSAGSADGDGDGVGDGDGDGEGEDFDPDLFEAF